MGKRIFTVLAIVLLVGTAQLWAQDELCATNQVFEKQLKEDPGLANRMENLERRVQEWISQQDIKRTANEVYTIPVVVHIVYQDSSEMVDDEVVREQIEILNRDFRMMNEDASIVRPRFKDRAADVGIEFCLAQRDPDGNPTTGITKTEGEALLFGFPIGFYDPFTNNIKSTESGGKSPWPVDQYLNIWVGNISADLLGILGYAQLPQSYMDPDSVPSQEVQTDGVVIDFRAFGTSRDYLITADGRSLTHEVGHWLGLRHIWGDGDCTKDDFVDDTPITDGAAQECDTTRNTCVTDTTGLDEPDLVENFMDYALGCASMFTVGQKERMLGYLLNDSLRASLLVSEACLPSVTAINPRKQNIDWEVFPNPTSGHIQLQWQLKKPIKATIEVLDMQGRVVYRKNSLQTSMAIDLSNQARGVYMVRLRTEEGQSVKKIVLK